jgi:hypothetical protein
MAALVRSKALDYMERLTRIAAYLANAVRNDLGCSNTNLGRPGQAGR